MYELKLNESHGARWVTIIADTLVTMLCVYGCGLWLAPDSFSMLLYTGVAGLCSLVCSLWIPSVTVTPKMRFDQILQQCARRAVLLLITLCTVLSLLHTEPLLRKLVAASLVCVFLSTVTVRTVLRSHVEADDTPKHTPQILNFGNRIIKRSFDILGCLLCLITFYPVEYLVVCILTKIQDPGPVYTTEKRCGMDGRIFSRPLFRMGRWMENSNLRRLPLLFCILKGDMSFVGPRALTPANAQKYQQLMLQHGIHYTVKPGLTGWAQVNGIHGEPQEESELQQHLEHDTWYMNHWTPWLDLCIVLKTIVH